MTTADLLRLASDVRVAREMLLDAEMLPAPRNELEQSRRETMLADYRANVAAAVGIYEDALTNNR